MFIIFVTGWDGQDLIGIVFFEIGVDEGFECCCSSVKVVPYVAQLTDGTKK